MSKEVLTPVALPTTVGNYTAAQDVSAINSSMRIGFEKTILSTQACAVFTCDDTTIAAGSITGTFSISDSSTWPNGGRGVRLVGMFQGGAYNLAGAPRTFVDIIEPSNIGAGLILLRTAGTTAANVTINGLGDTTFPNASITSVPLTLLERDASGLGFLVGLVLGAVGAVVSPSGDIRITSAAQTVLSAADVGTGLVANPLIRTDGADGLSIGPTGVGLTGSLALTCAGVMSLGDDGLDRTIQIGSGTGASRVSINGGTSAASSWSIGAAGILSLGANATDHRVNVGNGTGTSLLNLVGGTGGIALTSTGAGGIVMVGGTSAANAWNGSAGGATISLCSAAFDATLNLGTGAAVIATTVGSLTTTSSTAIQAGSGGVSLTSSAGLSLLPHGVGAGNTGELRFRELAAGGVNYTGFKAPDALAGNVIYVLPIADGAGGTKLTTDGAGNLSWS